MRPAVLLLRGVRARLGAAGSSPHRPTHTKETGFTSASASVAGVLLLNAVLTVRAHDAASHSKKGWEQITDAAIAAISRSAQQRVVFLLWGNYAKVRPPPPTPPPLSPHLAADQCSPTVHPALMLLARVARQAYLLRLALSGRCAFIQ